MSTTEGAAITLVAIDDDAQSLQLLRETLGEQGLEIVTATDPRAGLELVLQRRPQIVLLDPVLPGANGLELLERIVDFDPGIDVVLMTAFHSTGSAVTAIQKGARDYLNKPLSVAELRQRINTLIGETRQRQCTSQLDPAILEACRFQEMMGRSPLMREVFARIQRVAPHYRTALVVGPTGSGKELAARALHRLSPVAKGPLVAANCSAIVETLFESELFGHVRGAFTGATRDTMGLFEYAHGGTLVLDEIGDLPLACQSKLLRVLQDHQIQRVGSPELHRVDVRVIAITNRDLVGRMAERKFREDLYYRLSMVEIKLPALGKRQEDLPLLTRHFVQRFAAQYRKPIRGVTRRAQAVLARYPWPGNVRELENVLGDACMRVEGEMVDVRDLPERLQAQWPQATQHDEELLPLAELDRRHALRVLERVGGNKVRAAEILGISRATLYRLLGEPLAEEKRVASQARG
jgi:DNA-binding NtrC family response regulator